MKRTFGMTAMVIAFSALAVTASASPTSCGPPAVPPSLVADTVDAGNTVGSLTYTCGGLTFSNFFATDAGGVPIGTTVFLSSATFDSTTGIVLLNFNPSLTLGTAEDLHFSFTVTGAITAVDLTVFGSNSSISETICGSPIVPVNTGCSPALVPTINRLSGQSEVTSNTFSSSLTTIFKDINKGADGDLTSFNQSFHTAVPEPMTLSMMGVGLLGLGLMRRRQAGKK